MAGPTSLPMRVPWSKTTESPELAGTPPTTTPEITSTLLGSETKKLTGLIESLYWVKALGPSLRRYKHPGLTCPAALG